MLLAAALLAATCLAGAQQPIATAGGQGASLDQIIPPDPLITLATLPNGLRYYIRANKQPRNRAELRLVVNAGSILEDEDQRGLAHFVEHMCFNGTAHFPGQDVGRFMQAIGMRSGAHVNARTSFDETVYQLQIPTEDPAVVDRSLLILEDWAHNASFNDLEIEKERGVVLEEWRLGLGADARMRDALFPVVLKGSRYTERLPIGKPEIIQRVNHDRLKQFYTDWYRPDLMAVIVVGDVDTSAVEGLIRSHFGSIPAAAAPKPRPDYAVPDHAETLFAVTTDREATATTINVYSKSSVREPMSIGTYRRQMIDRLFSGMLSARFAEMAQKPDGPFLAAQSRRGLFVRSEEMATLSAVVKEDGIERGLTALFAEADRVARFGFTETEFERQRLNVHRIFERAVGEKDNQVSASLADEYVRNFVQREPIPGIVYEYALHERFLPEITLAEVNALAVAWTAESNRVVAITAPLKPGLTMPGEGRLAAVIKAATGGASTAYVDTISTRPLLSPLPTPGAIVKSSTREEFGITEWQLLNGVRVVLKPTTLKEDEILFRAVSPGGTSLASDRDYIAAETAARVIARSGVGTLSEIEVRKALAGNTASVRPEIGEMEEGLSGGASRKDLETMFQLIYLAFTQPRADPQVFDVLKGQLKATLANRSALPDAVFQDALAAALSQNHRRARPMTPASVDEMSLARSLAFYKDRFADASDFTFVFVGSFDLATMQPFVERYLGSLPALFRRETWKDVGIRPPTHVVEKRVERGIEPRSRVSIVFTGPFEYDQMHRTVIRAMAEMLGGKLSARLREDLGGTYGVSVESSAVKIPSGRYSVSIAFACDPARADDLVRTAFEQIEQFKASGPSTGQVVDARAALLRDFETNSQQNRYLLGQIVSKYQNGEDVDEVFGMREFYDKLTPSMIGDAARQYLRMDRYVKVMLFPEKK